RGTIRRRPTVARPTPCSAGAAVSAPRCDLTARTIHHRATAPTLGPGPVDRIGPTRTPPQRWANMAAVIDPAFVQWITSEGNRAHRSMGTELVAIEPDGVAIALAWRADLA